MSKEENKTAEPLENLEYYYVPSANLSVKAKDINDSIIKAKGEKK